MTTACKLLCEGWLHKMEFASRRSASCQDLPLGVLFMEMIRSCSIRFEFSHYICWFWGLLGGTLVQVKVRPCLWPVMGNLFWATKQFTIGSCLCLAWVHIKGIKIHTKASYHQYLAGKDQQKAQGSPIHTTLSWLPVRLSHWQSLGTQDVWG